MIKTVKTLREANPEAADMWIYDTYYNGLVTPETVNSDSKKNGRFRCINNPDHIFLKMIKLMSDKNNPNYGCDICNSNSKIINKNTNIIDESNQNPISILPKKDLDKLKGEWSINNKYSIDYYSDISEYPALWICRRCGKEYNQSIKKRINNNECPFCKNETKLKEFNIDITDPDINFDISYKNMCLQTDTKIGISIPFRLKCIKCNKDYESTISERVNNKSICPECTYKNILKKHKTIADEFPDLINKWSISNGTAPNEHISISKQKFIWECDKCKGQYLATISQMVEYDEPCPYCDSRELLFGVNSIDIKYPELLKEWNYEANYLLSKPSKTFSGDINKYWWRCKICNYNYKMSTQQKTINLIRSINSCPKCKGRRQEYYHLY